MNIKCLPRIRGVPTSFYKLNMMFSTNQGTPQDYSSLHQIKAVAHMTPGSKHNDEHDEAQEKGT